MVKESSPIKLTVDNDVLQTLDEVAIQIRQAMREGRLPKRGPGRAVGASTIAAGLIEKVVREYPEILQQLLSNGTSQAAKPPQAALSDSDPPVERAAETRKKARSQR